MNELKTVAKKHRTLIAVFLTVGITMTFLQNFGARYFQRVVDNFTNGTLTIINIMIYGAALIMLYIISYLFEYPWRTLEHSIELSLKTAALRKVSVIDYLSYTKLGTGTLIQRIENGASAGRNILFGFYLRLAGELLPAMIISIIFVYSINKTVMLAILAGYLVVFIISNLLLKALYKVKENILVNEEMFNHFLVRGFMEMVVFRINRRFASEIQKTEAASKKIISSKVKMKMVHEAFFTIFALLIGFVKIGIVIYGWSADALTIGQIVALIALVDNAYQPIAILNVEYIDYKLAKIAFARYSEFLGAKEDERLSQGESVAKLEGSISFSRVGFHYNEREVLRDFNLNIDRGKSIALVGESGSGKSTAVKLLVGLLQPSSGSIEVGGMDLSRVNLNSYYDHIVYLPQEPPIFNGSLRENLIFDERVGEGDLMKAISFAGLDDLYSKLENGLDTQVGEKGISLSGGERQQLALARLWFSKADIVIFDEATSAIDNLTEEALMKKVMCLLKEKTVIAIAHRLDSIKAFDNIILLRDGQIAERGSFDDLIGRRRMFYELYSRAERGK